MGASSTRAKWRSLRSARSSTLKKHLTPPTLSETRCFAKDRIGSSGLLAKRGPCPLTGFRGCLSVFQRGLKGNLLAGRINPVDVKCRVGREKNPTGIGTYARGPVDVMSGQVVDI